MAIDIRPTNAPNLALGICLVLAGVGLTLESAHVIQPGQIRQYWPLGLVVLGAGVVLGAFGPRSADPATGRSVSGGLGPTIAVLLAFFVLSQAFEHRGQAMAADDRTGDVKMYAVLGGSHVISHAARFTGGEMNSLMGGSELDLRQAVIPRGEEAVLDVTVIMGGGVIRVPDAWRVDVHGLSVLGGIDDQRRTKPAAENETTTDPAANAPRLVLRGDLVMGGLVIKN